MIRATQLSIGIRSTTGSIAILMTWRAFWFLIASLLPKHPGFNIKSWKSQELLADSGGRWFGDHLLRLLQYSGSGKI
ncbi:hypothetical protein BDV35DRAFT_157714 [Aspergillus flavus]|uniref:Uncharacterized protein n=1 Tax=Aspergillus flavus TaxID=5059 RepID=A0A5N6GBY6_ASPFL|nr:hypothetical protein BDV35DRAFT_157714 [Aspergillus flavus]